ncbi:MAG: response regulator [Candidatus Sericytochromatia bacterium]|nr:response regulator [Candidatus Sericytochromatia bacterium]MEB3221435.1 response regulator [Candidatus Sericytochromatia bacterium]
MPQLILGDKSDLFRRSISAVLQNEGYEVVPAESGQKVLQLVHTTRPVAIILDAETPEPSGLETLLLLKRNPQFRRIPVILVTRDTTAPHVVNTFRAVADAIMFKPIDVNVLLKNLAGVVRPAPSVSQPIEASFGVTRIVARLRFIDQYGTLYLDKEPQRLRDGTIGRLFGLAPVGSMGTISFDLDRGARVFQRVLLDEENEAGLAVFPAGDPGTSDPPDVLRIPVNYQGRYLVPGSVVKSAMVSQLHGQGVLLAGLDEEPRFNTPIQTTVLSPAVGVDVGITFQGKVTATRAVPSGRFEAEVLLTEPPGSAYVSLLAEASAGRPFRSVG